MLMSKSRLEKFLYALYSLDSSDLPTPLSRIEELYKCLVTGEEAPTFKPISRVEKYLMAILGAYNVNELPNPISRVEVLLHKLAIGDDNLDDIKSFLSEHEELLAEIIRNGGAGGNINIEYVLYTLSTEYNILYNTAEKPVKSAILKGKGYDGLVNISSLKGEITIAPNSVQFIDCSLIKTTTTYTISFNCSSVPSTGSIEVRQVNGSAALKMDNITVTQGYNQFIVLTHSSEVTRFRFKNDSASTTDFIFNDLMILEGDYRGVDIPYFEGINSVQMPVLTISNEDDTKTITVTCNEEVELRGIGDVQDELDLLTGELTRRIDESGNILSQEITESIDISVVDQDGNSTKLSTFNDLTHVTLSSEGLIPEAELEVATKNEEDLEDTSVYTVHTLSEGYNTLYNTAEKPVKSAILKGNTLVNGFNNSNFTPISISFDTNTPRTAYVEVNVTINTGVIGVKIYGKYSSVLKLQAWAKSTVIQGGLTHVNGIFKFDCGGNTLTKLMFYVSTPDFISGCNELINNIAIFEYQDGMENWDIPYFEGMQSVKMPVLKTTGKNLFDGKILNYKDINVNTGQESASGDRTISVNFIKVTPNTTYTFTRPVASGNVGIRYYSITQSFITSKAFSDHQNKFSATFTTPSNCYFIKFIDEANTLEKGYQIESGSSVATTYEPYKSNILTTSEEVTLRGIGDVKDELDCLTGELTTRVGEYEINATTPKGGFNDTGEKTIYFYVNQTYLLSMPKVNAPLISNSVIQPILTDLSKLDVEGVHFTSKGNLHVRIDKSRLSGTSSSEVSNYLRENPITIQYQLAKESVKTVDLSVVDQDGNDTELSTFNDITHVTLSSEGLIPEAELEVAEKVPEVATSMLTISREQEVINATANEQSENVDATMIATTEIYEDLL